MTRCLCVTYDSKAACRRCAMARAAIRWSAWSWPVAAMLAASLGPAVAQQSGTCAGRGEGRGPQRRILPARRRGLFPRHGRRLGADRRRKSRGREHVERLDRRRRPLLGRHDEHHLRRLRPAEDRHLASRPDIRPRFALELSRRRQRALLRQADRPRPRPLRPVAGQAQSGLPARSVRERTEISRRRDRRARQDRAGRLVLRLRIGHRRAAPVPQSRLRRGGEEGLGPGALLHRPQLLQPQGPRAAVSRRHVLRLLPYRPEPDQPAGRSCASGLEKPELHRRRAIHVGGPRVRLLGEPGQLPVPVGPHLPAGQHGHLAGLDRQHQQPAHDERDLQSRRAHGAGAALGQGDAGRRRAQQQAAERLRQDGHA